jgi:hypothetical protein
MNKKNNLVYNNLGGFYTWITDQMEITFKRVNQLRQYKLSDGIRIHRLIFIVKKI